MTNKIPSVIKFGYCDFRESEKVIKGEVKLKSNAKCIICKESITETRGTTSSYRSYNSIRCLAGPAQGYMAPVAIFQLAPPPPPRIKKKIKSYYGHSW